MKSILLSIFFPLLISGAPYAAQDENQASRAELESKFEAQMSGCKMVGKFTMFGRDQPAKEDSYTIAKVTKLKDDDWRFEAKIEYGDKSVTVPLVVQVVWAGDTPTIQVTNLMVPMMGKYSARVAIYEDYYAGLWFGDGYGGHMFGKIEKAAEAVEEKGEVKKAAARGQDSQAVDANWGNWRGPLHNGIADSANPPTEWAEDKNIKWKVALPGLGSSSPIVWGDRIYVTSAVETEVEGKPPELPGQAGQGRRGGGQAGTGRRGGNRQGGRRRGGQGGRGGGAPTKVHEFVVMALDRADGSVVWQTTVAEEVPHERGHATASQASNSPVTDGEHIFASFGSRGLHCLNMDGELQWSKKFGYMRTRNQFGEGSSPALHGDILVVNWDHEGDSFIAAFNKTSGEELWRNPRDEPTSWATPTIVDVEGTPQVFVTGTGASRGYDLATGEELWSLGGMTFNCIPTSNYVDGVAYLMSGFRGYNIQAVMLAGADGDLTDSEQVLWSHGNGTSYVPSALVYDGFVYFLADNNGVLSCLDAETGEVHYERHRMRGFRTVYASPVGAAGRVYLTSREGVTKVIKLGGEYEELATNELEDGFDATPAIVGNQILLRGRENLYCISEN